MLLAVEGLTVRYGAFTALRDVSFSLDPGVVLGVIGPNGAGKTTLINAVTGIFRPSAGTIRFREKRIEGLRSDQIARLGVARTFQNLRLFEKLTVGDNLRAAQNQHLTFREQLTPFARYPEGEKAVAGLLEELGLPGKADAAAGDLSYGDRRRVEIGRALAGNPDLLILDEPGAGMNDRESAELTRLIRRMNRSRNLAVLLVEHDMNIIRDACDRVLVLDYGVKLMEGSYAEAARDPRVIEAYLGVGEGEDNRAGAE